MDIFSAYFRKWHPYAERFLDFLVFSHCNKDTLICRTDIYPGIHFRIKVIPPWMKIGSFLCKYFNWISIRTGLRRLNWVVSHQKHHETRNVAPFWVTEVFKLSYLSTKIICNKTGGLALNVYRKLTTYAKEINFSRNCSRLVDVRDDMIPFC